MLFNGRRESASRSHPFDGSHEVFIAVIPKLGWTTPVANRSCWKHGGPYPQARDPQAAAMGRCSRDYCMEIGAAAAPAGLPS